MEEETKGAGVPSSRIFDPKLVKSSRSNRAFDELVNIPPLIRIPSGEKQGKTSELIELIDLPPTLVDLCGINRKEWQGINFLSSAKKEKEFVYSFTKPRTYGGSYSMIRSRTKKLIHVSDPLLTRKNIKEYFAGKLFTQNYNFFPEDHLQPITSKTERERFYKDLQKWNKECKRIRGQFSSEKHQVKGEIKRRLKELGYL